jgi:cytochrome c556
MKKSIAAAGLALCATAFMSAAAFAQAKPETLVAQRQAAMTLQGKYLYSIIPMAQGKVPYDAKVVARNVEYLGVLTQMPWDGFTPETANVTVKTRAMPEIYKDQAAFRQKIEAMRAQVTKLEGTVKTGNEAAIKEGLTDLNRSCNSCHDQFRAKS